MLDKIKEILNSVRFWQITGAAMSAYLADLATNGFSLPKLLMYVSGWLATVAGVGTVDKFGANLKGNLKGKK